MSQHDYNIANQSGATTRADLNTLFQAIAGNNSGATAPSTTFAFQWWADTATDILKQRNAANTAWISVMKMSTGVVLQKDTTDGIAGLTALKINFKNVANTFTSFFTNTNTAARTYTFPNKDMTVAGLDDTTVASTKLPQITITAATGAITVAGIAKYLDFRSATLTSGTPSTVNANPADLVIPSGATLGVTTTLSGRIIVAEMNNAGTSEYAVANISGGLQMDEMNVISTTAISTTSDAKNVWYSTTARSNLPYRIVACFDAVNTAGAWGSPTLVQPSGGSANIFPLSGGQSFATSGYSRMGPLLIQWGSTGSIGTNSTVTPSFPVTFPNACLHVFLTCEDLNGNNNGLGFSASSLGTTGFTAKHYSTDASAKSYRYIAIGY